MSESAARQSWWQTLPGILTALAALLTAVGGILALLFQYGVLGDGKDSEVPPPPRAEVPSIEVMVDGTKPWTDTRVDVVAGDVVEVVAWSEVFHNEGSSIGPEGFPNRPDLLTPLVSANHAGLLGRIGTGEPFYMGRGTTFEAERNGRLILGINDSGLENNRGFFTAEITVHSD